MSLVWFPLLLSLLREPPQMQNACQNHNSFKSFFFLVGITNKGFFWLKLNKNLHYKRLLLEGFFQTFSQHLKDFIFWIRWWWNYYSFMPFIQLKDRQTDRETLKLNHTKDMIIFYSLLFLPPSSTPNNSHMCNTHLPPVSKSLSFKHNFLCQVLLQTTNVFNTQKKEGRKDEWEGGWW